MSAADDCERVDMSNEEWEAKHAEAIRLFGNNDDVYDWDCALAYGSPDEYVKVIASSTGQNDGDSWIAVFECKQGNFAFLSAYCDYTGWDCQAGGDATIAPDLESLKRGAMGIDDRRRLGMLLEGEECALQL